MTAQTQMDFFWNLPELHRIANIRPQMDSMFQAIVEKLNELIEDYEEEYEEMDYADLLENFLMEYCNGDDTTILDIVELYANMHIYHVYIQYINDGSRCPY